MRPHPYAFTSRWRIPAPPEACWGETERMLRPGARSWWPGVRMTGRLAVGTDVAVAVRSPLGYRLRMRLTVAEATPGRRVVARSVGDLDGIGTVELRRAAASGTEVIVRWEVTTRRAWMNATAFALRPAFALAHRIVMRAGERGLTRAVRRRGSEPRNADSSGVAGG